MRNASARIMRKVTMVPSAQAKKNMVFRALLDPRCFKCKLFNACSGSLRAGGRYRVVNVRRVSHFCPVIGDEMVVVEVESEPVLAAVESKVAVEGVSLAYSKVECNAICTYRDYCTRAPLLNGENVKVARVLSRIPCPQSRSLTLVELLPLA